MKISIKSDFADKVTAGYKKMKGSSVAICGIVRDCAEPLVKNIPVVERLRELFLQSYVVISENDSTDGTKEILGKWSQDSKNVFILSKDTGANTWPNSSDNGVHPAYSFHRISRMAGFRNKYLDFVEKNLTVDYLIVVDLDIFSISIEGVANTFGQPIEWDAVSSNGRNIPEKRDFFNGYRYYDTYAFREVGDSRPQTEDMIRMYQKTLRPLTAGMPMLRVASGFNGLAVYKWEAVKGLRYGCDKNNDQRVEVEVEHSFLHRQMAKNNNDRIYVNPSQIVYYDSYFCFFKKMIRAGMKRIISFGR